MNKSIKRRKSTRGGKAQSLVVKVDAEEKEYGIFRGASRNGIPFWHVNIGRRRYKIERCFFDGVYGGRDAALALARDYRDEALTIIPPTTNLDASVTLRADNSTGFAGIHQVRYKGKLVAWIARLANRGKVLWRSFSATEYGEDGAKAEAMAQRERWLENLDLAFRTIDELATQTAEDVFPEYLENRVEPLRMPDEEIRQALAELDARFDALRPLWATVRVTMRKSGAELYLYVSDSGWPARKYYTAVSLQRHSLGAALAVLRAKVATLLGDYFGADFRESFLAVYGREFNAGMFNTTDGISLREKPDTVHIAAAKLEPPSPDKPFEHWLNAWEVETWRDGRHFWEPPADGSLYALARCLADLAYQAPPCELASSPLKGRRDRQYQEAGVGISRQRDGWLVALMRQGRTIRRRFADVHFGGQEEGLEVAQAYRDAVITAFPDVRSYKKRMASHRNNTSGVTGVHEIVRNGKRAGWQAQINSKQLGIRKAFFSVAEHGDEEAKSLAIAARQQWVSELYETTERDVMEAAQPLDDDTFAAKFAEIEQRFGPRGKAMI